MRRFGTLVLTGCWALAAVAGTLGARDAEGERTADAVGADRDASAIRAPLDAAVWKLVVKAIHPGYTRSHKEKAARAVKAMDRGRVVAALGGMLSQDDKRYYALSFIGRHFPDGDLVPSVAACIRHSEGRVLLEAVRTAKAMPAPKLLGPLIEHALMDDYGGRKTVVTPHGGEGRHVSLFAEVTHVLNAITGGTTGLTPVSARDATTDKKRELRQKWQDWWGKNKAKWEAAEYVETSRILEQYRDDISRLEATIKRILAKVGPPKDAEEAQPTSEVDPRLLAVAEAMAVLGRLRSAGSASLLASHVTFTLRRNLPAGGAPELSDYPAAKALARIGVPGVRAVLAEYAAGGGSTQRRLARLVITDVLGKEAAREYLRGYMSREGQAAKKRRLEQLLQSLK